MAAFLGGRISHSQRNAADAALRRFSSFCLEQRHGALATHASRAAAGADALLDAFLSFLLHLFDSEELQPASIANIARSLALGLRSDGSTTDDLRATPQCRDVLDVMRTRRPARARLTGTLPFHPRQLLSGIETDDVFAHVRDRALVLMRIESLMRPGQEPASIRRSTVQPTTDTLGRAIVTFEYASKTTKRARAAVDTNYVSHICEAHERPRPPVGAPFAPRQHCPACAMLELRALLDAPAIAGSIADHDFLFTASDGEPLSPDRCSTIVKDCMRRAGLDGRFTPHSIRNAVNNLLTMRGISHDDICVRAGWATSSSNRARTRHYNHFRLVQQNFARVLLLDPADVNNDQAGTGIQS